MKSVLSTVFFLILNSVFAQDISTEFTEEENRSDWGFNITPYALLAAQSTDVGGERIRQSFNDLSSLTNAGFQLLVSGRYKKLITSFDGTWANLGTDVTQSALKVNVSINQRIFDFRAGYLVFENYDLDGNDVIKGWSLELGAGAKYWKNEVELTYALVIGDSTFLEGSLNEPQEWWDLMFSIKPRIIITPKVYLAAALSVGGFGINNSADFSYDFLYSNSFKVTKFMLVNAGFRNFQYRRTDGEGDEKLKTKVNVIGPFLGVTFLL